MFLNFSEESSPRGDNIALYQRQETLKVAIIVDGGSFLTTYRKFMNLAVNKAGNQEVVGAFKSAITSLCSMLRATFPNFRLEFEQVDFFHATHDGQPSALHRSLQVWPPVFGHLLL